MIEIFGDTNCVWCERAKKLCEDNQLTYTYKGIQEPGVLTQLQEKLDHVRTVPQIFWNGRHIGGYQELATEIEDTRNFGQESI